MRKKLILLLIAAMIAACGCSKKEQDRFVLVEGRAAIAASADRVQEEPAIHDFYIGKYEVTQEEWTEVMGNNPSTFKGSDLPVESVSWYDSIEYCNRRSEKEGLSPYYKIDKKNRDPENICDYDDIRWTVTVLEGANGYRLPTEAEWTYAAGGGEKTQNYTYSGSSDEEEAVWYWRNAGNEYQKGDWYWPDIEANQTKPHPVGKKKANELGIYDMSGNVREWCFEWYQDTKIPMGFYRVWKGGGWVGDITSCQISYRGKFEPNGRGADMGIRVCRDR
ncbi:formylglycine-generating enzyme family protein [Lacrimispora amygdalina]|uniref:formylglycine-generating enzyme family protein n=1 Tax=Lacrimispora amygdalina TaxID=253257 RepID=UPI000BE41B37|nr:SUMF1/EgtB/PvdO family nonheme iron enzyme [Lacrimispora amygdalina]